MPNGRNSGRLYPGIPGDYEVLVFEDGRAVLKWAKEGTALCSFPHLTSEDSARSYAQAHGIEFRE